MNNTPDNDLGVLDHYVTFPTGETVHNPIRVIPYGDDQCEFVFTLRRQPGVSDAEFERDARMVTADLARLKELLEQGEQGAVGRAVGGGPLPEYGCSGQGRRGPLG